MTLLETKSLIIRNFVLSDWEALRHLILQYQSSEYAAYDHQWPTSEVEIKKITAWFASGDSYFAVCLKGTRQFIGFVSLSQEPDRASPVLNLGYVFDAEHHGKGFATEACRAVIGQAFERLHARKVVTATADANTPSCKLLKRLGFTPTAEQIGSFRSTPEGNPIEFIAHAYELSSDDWAATGR